VAAIEDDCWPAPDRRILITCNNAAFPEATGGLLDTPGVDKLLGHFDDVYDYNAVIAPQHPSIWRPAAAELPMLQRFFAATWQVPADEEVILVVESIHVPPARTLCQIFPDARIDVYADGLMTYGPTRDGMFTAVGFRIDRLLHLDLVPGVKPLVLHEWRVKPLPISTDRFRDVISRMAAESPTMITTAAPGTVAVLLGQYLSDAGILTIEEELELHRDLIRGAVRAGFTKLIFKPHPTAAETDYDRLLADAAEAGVELVVHRDPDLVETWFSHPGIGLVAGCFSTALVTASALYRLPAARTGTELLLERVRPYENSNRIPVTIAHAALPELATYQPGQVGPGSDGPVGVGRIVQVVGYCMQASRVPELRPVAVRVLAEHWDGALRVYLKRRRLTVLDLPGKLSPRRRTAKPKPRRPVRTAVKRLVGPRVATIIRERRRALNRLLRGRTLRSA
jgi:hypothetical protein